MLFNSSEFIFIFFPLTLVAFLAAGLFARPPLAVVVLVVASFVFYVYWRVDDLALLAVSITINFTTGHVIGRLVGVGRARSARSVLIAGVGFNIALIAFFKYASFLVGTMNSAFGIALPIPSIALPLGISFFTFTQITFLVDVYRDQTSETSPLRYALFVTFFPHLIAGPILHHGMMAPQFRRRDLGKVHGEEFVRALVFFVAGLCKKVLLADSIGSYANPVFDAAARGEAMTFWEAWSGVLAYTMQIYFDFSGYSDMAIGLALVFGIRLPINFNSPYQAVNIVDFWRRWHMTLSSFLREYLYIPLGGNRHGALVRYRNLLLTMLLGGLWHGASWTFMLWGGLHGAMICINHAWQRLPLPQFPLPSRLRAIFAQSITFVAVTICWVPFRADSFETTWRIWRVMAGFEGVTVPEALSQLVGLPAGSMFGNALLGQGRFWLFELAGMSEQTIEGVVAIALLYGVCVALPNVQNVLKYDPDASERSAAAVPSVKWPMVTGSIVALVFWICIFSLNRPTQFLYFNF